MNRPIAFFLFPGFQLVDLGAMTVFDLANSEYGGGPYDLRIVSAHGTPIRSAAGATPVGQRVQKAWAALDVPQCGYCQACHRATNSADGRDPARNGNRKTPHEVVEHMRTDPLVLWAWQPGGNRTTPALSHDDFVKAFVAWADAGLPCPDTP